MCEHHVDEYIEAFYHFSEKRGPARKVHECGECKGEIPKGSFYIYQAGKDVDEERPWEFKTCLRCRELWSEFRKNLENSDHISPRDQFCDCLGSLFEQIGRALTKKGLLCWEFVFGLIKEELFPEEEVCPAAPFSGYKKEPDPRQLQLEFA